LYSSGVGGNLTEEEAGQDEYQNLESLSIDLKEFYEELNIYSCIAHIKMNYDELVDC